MRGKISPMTSDPLPPSSLEGRRSSDLGPALFQERQAVASSSPERAGTVVLALAAALLVFARNRPAPSAGALLPIDPYAGSLTVSNLAMSESTSLSGGKSTFIDGSVRHTGDSTVTAATVQVLFRNDQALPPQVETLPLTIIRTRAPYIDIEPIGVAPLRPGDEREFRLIFENIGANWNQAIPEIHIVHVARR